jgi:hypothetical protein
MLPALAANLLTVDDVADRLHFAGLNRNRWFQRLFMRHGVQFIRRGKGVYFVTERQYAALIEAMTTCSQSESAANTSTSAVRSVSGGKRASSRNILAAQIAATLQTPTDRSSKRIYATKSFTVVAGGRTP